MRRVASAFVCLVSLVGFVRSIDGRSAQEAVWELVKHSDGVAVYRRHIPGSDVIAFKGEGILDAPISRLASILLDTDRAREWVANLVESRVVRNVTSHEYIEYNHVSTPMFVKDREFVSRVEIVVDAESKTFMLKYNKSESPDVVASKHVRGELTETVFKLASVDGGKRTRVSAEVHADPKGSIPKWLVNFFQKDWLMDTFSALKKQANKADIRKAPRFLDIIEQVERL